MDNIFGLHLFYYRTSLVIYSRYLIYSGYINHGVENGRSVRIQRERIYKVKPAMLSFSYGGDSKFHHSEILHCTIRRSTLECSNPPMKRTPETPKLEWVGPIWQHNEYT